MADTLILASASLGRRHLLAAAGLAFEVDPARIDEGAAKAAWRQAGGDAAGLAGHLAALKACEVSLRHPDALVIGADQILVLDGEVFDKPRDRARAADHLRRLQGRTHRLRSAVACARRGEVVWSHADDAWLAMRPLDDERIERYLDGVGPDAVTSVGAYRIEGPGVQLFTAVEGQHFTVIGLPMLPLLAFLRDHAPVTAGLLP